MELEYRDRVLERYGLKCTAEALIEEVTNTVAGNAAEAADAFDNFVREHVPEPACSALLQEVESGYEDWQMGIREALTRFKTVVKCSTMHVPEGLPLDPPAGSAAGEPLQPEDAEDHISHVHRMAEEVQQKAARVKQLEALLEARRARVHKAEEHLELARQLVSGTPTASDLKDLYLKVLKQQKEVMTAKGIGAGVVESPTACPPADGIFMTTEMPVVSPTTLNDAFHATHDSLRP